MPVNFLMNIILLVFLGFIKDSLEIRNVRLILPSIVQAGTSATLLCLYDLEGASLYSVQWYRGQFEFYRFVPSENPPIKVFQVPGLYVDTFASNEHQVTLRNLPAQISGQFSCEITTDAPPFSTSCASGTLKIVDLTLDLKIPQTKYQFGNIIKVNCSLNPVIPSTRLIFHWNGRQISENYIYHNLKFSLLQLNTTIFDQNQSSSVTIQLRCSAILDNIYYIVSKSVSLELEPSHSSDKSNSTKLQNCFLIFMFVIINII